MRYVALLPALVVAGCNDGTTGPPSPPPVENLQPVLVTEGLSNPLHLTAPPDDERLFVIEQEGRIRVIRDGSLLPDPFLDLSSVVSYIGEEGLLGLAFDPHYAATGHFWIYYTDRAEGATVLKRYSVSDDPDMADPASGLEVLRIEQPTWSHNGGQLDFGPDGMLYIAVGDGGEYEDPRAHAQNPNTLLGTLLRIDVRGAEPYTTPPDNPYSGLAHGRPEIWAYGLRNPWRFSFDTVENLLFVSDVGQNDWEEINIVPADTAPVNYGWNIMEGSECFAADTCDREGLTEPALTYSHADGCSVIGGYVYRGERLIGLQGHYFFGDYCQGWVQSVRVANATVTERHAWDLGFIGHILGFGQDAAGEIYVLTTTGSVYRLERAAPAD